LLKTGFTKLIGCSVPIQQAGMAALANPELAAAVSEAGALGMVSVGGFPPEKVTRELELVRKRTLRPFGANFLIPGLTDEDIPEVSESVRAASKLARLVEFFYHEPQAELVKIVHSERALACWQVGSKVEAGAATDAGCDMIIAQGIEAGGHIRGRIGLMALLDQVLSKTDIPVIAAGGISSGRAMAASLAAGAAAVRVGTRFAAAEEAGAHPVYQRALVKSEAEDTIFTEAFGRGWPNAPHRVTRSSVEAAQAFQGEEVGQRYLKSSDEWAPVLRFQPIAVTKEVRGNVEAMPQWAGEGVGSVKSILPAAKIVDQLSDEAEKLLRRWSSQSFG